MLVKGLVFTSLATSLIAVPFSIGHSSRLCHSQGSEKIEGHYTWDNRFKTFIMTTFKHCKALSTEPKIKGEFMGNRDQCKKSDGHKRI